VPDEERQPEAVAEEEAPESGEEETAAKAGEYLAALQRERADFLNYKRRIEQESRQVASAAAAMVVDRFLPVLDDFALATAAVDPSIASLPWTQGILGIQRKLESVLEGLGVKEVEVEGKPFDPRVSEALMQTDGPENAVVKVLQRGYQMGDQLVRPARVVVGRGGGENHNEAPAGAQTNDNNESSEGQPA
jgi:molecular chaperone GrpE